MSNTSRYITVMETNGKECESWYYFIKEDGNEENIKHLQEQIESFDWYVMDEQSAFDIEIEHTVSSTTAKEMTKLEVNSHTFHRKFDGKLQKIDLEFKKKDSNETKMCKAFDMIGYGRIEDFLSDEDIDDEDIDDEDIDDEDIDDEDIDDEDIDDEDIDDTDDTDIESNDSSNNFSKDNDSFGSSRSNSSNRSKHQSPLPKNRIPPILKK